ncbi:MAG: hypothetical protein ABI378_04105 [Chitinophagaceae bacterium]
MMRSFFLIFLLAATSCSGRRMQNSDTRSADSTIENLGFSLLTDNYGAIRDLSTFQTEGNVPSATPELVFRKIEQDLKEKISKEYPSDSATILENIFSSKELILWNIGSIENATIYLFHFHEMALGDQYWLYLFKEGKISSTAFTFSSESLDSGQFQNNSLPAFTIKNESNEIVVATGRRNGNVYNAIVTFYLKSDASLQLSQEIKVETEALIPFAPEARKIERQIIITSASDNYQLNVFSIEANAQKKLVGKVQLQQKQRKWTVIKRDVLDKKFKNLLITCSPNGEERFLNARGTF